MLSLEGLFPQLKLEHGSEQSLGTRAGIETDQISPEPLH